MATTSPARPAGASRHARCTRYPLCFLAYGALYAWGYVLWETPALSTEAVFGTEYDLSWLVSAAVVPLALAMLALVGWRRELERSRACYVAVPVLAALGTVLSVAYQHVPAGWSAVFAAASGVCTAIASALFVLLWSLAFARLNAGALEVLVPMSFGVSLVCALVAPAMAQLPALAFALVLVGLCTAGLYAARRRLDADSVDRRFVEEAAAGIDATAEERPLGIARMLVYGVVAWGVCGFAPCLADGSGTEGAAALPGGIDVVSCVGYLLAILFALAIIRYAVRVDFLALALMTLAPFVLSLTLYAVGGTPAVVGALVLNVALGACCEMVLLLYFVRLAQNKGSRRTFWLALGSAAGYVGVLVGQVAALLFARASVTVGERPLWCLGIICVYVFAMLLIPQRRPYRTEARAASAGYDGTMAAAVDGTGAPVAGGVPAGGTSSVATVGDVLASPLLPGGSGALPDSGPRSSGLLSDGPAVASDSLDAACMRVAERYQLSPREAEICAYLARGRSQTYIRDALFLSKNTVSTHTRHLYAKLGVHSKQELIDLVEQHRAG